MTAKAEEKKLKFKVISYTDYLPKAREMFGRDKSWENAVALIYSENEVVEVIERGGETKFVVKV